MVTGNIFDCFYFSTRVYPSVTQRNIKGYAEKLKAQDIADKEFHTLFEDIGKKFGTGIIMSFIFLLMFISFAASAGNAKA